MIKVQTKKKKKEQKIFELQNITKYQNYKIKRHLSNNLCTRWTSKAHFIFVLNLEIRRRPLFARVKYVSDVLRNLLAR